MGLFSSGPSLTTRDCGNRTPPPLYGSMFLKNRQQNAAPRASHAAIGRAAPGGNPVLQVAFPLRRGFLPRRMTRACPPALIQNVKTPLSANGSGDRGNFLLS